MINVIKSDFIIMKNVDDNKIHNEYEDSIYKKNSNLLSNHEESFLSNRIRFHTLKASPQRSLFK